MLNIRIIYASLMVTLIKLLLCTGPILEFNGSVEHIQKEHHVLLIQVDLILQN